MRMAETVVQSPFCRMSLLKAINLANVAEIEYWLDFDAEFGTVSNDSCMRKESRQPIEFALMEWSQAFVESSELLRSKAY